MADESVGQIGLDLVVNQNNFKKQMSGITGLAKKAGAALAAAFVVKKVVDFGKSCLELGSDLAEVQNVVDVTFPSMTAKVDEFAKSAASSFGLSETMAKKFTGTFGSMAKAFGFSESAAYDMGSTLTGLAGDVASFYNITQDEAYTKLKSVFTGETESLKDLGVVMTQSALDAYAMANGFGKTTQAMSEAEKVALRYQFVQNQLAAASGDFARTSGSWANQVRLLKLQFDSLKATIGQGLINLFTPIVKVINGLIGRLSTLANAFKSFTELITGKKSEGGSGVGAVASDALAASDGLESAAGSAGNLADNTGAVGSAAKKAAKEMKALMGFDQINKLDAPTETSDDSGSDTVSSGTGSSDSGLGGAAVDYGKLAEGETEVDKLDKSLQRLLNRAKQLGKLFQKGFSIGFGDSQKKINEIKGHLSGIKANLKEIFTDKNVKDGMNNLLNSWALTAGKIAGSFASVGITIAENLTGGINQYMNDSKDYIKERLKGIFNVNADIATLVGELFTSLADIFSVFGNETAQKLTGSVLGAFSNGFLGVIEIASRDIKNVLSVVVGVITENKDKIKTAFENTLSPLATVASSIYDLIKNSFSKLSDIYDEYIDPAFVKIKDGFSTAFGGALDAYNQYLAPVLSWIAGRFSKLCTTYIQPLINAFLTLFGTIVDSVSTLWSFMSPFVAWFIQGFIAAFASELQKLWTKFEFIFSALSSIVQGFIQVLTGIIQFITGVLTGDWTKAWNGIKEIFSGIWTAISGVITAAMNLIANTIKTVWNTIKNSVTHVLNGIKTVISGVWTTVKNVTKTAFDAVKNFITTPISSAKDTIGRALDAIKSKFGSAFEGIKNAVKSPINAIIGLLNGLISGMASAVNTVANMLNSLNIDIPDWVPGIGGGRLSFNLPTWTPGTIPYLAQGGFVEKNTPRIAMIGDNRHYGEIVAPEDKMQAMVDQAVAKVSGGVTREELEPIVNNAVMRLIAALSSIGFNLDGEQLATLQKVINTGLSRRFNNVSLT